MAVSRPRVLKQTKAFQSHYSAIRAKSPRFDDFFSGVRFVLQHDPSAGYHWGRGIWTLSSVRAPRLPLVTIFYTFDDQHVVLHDILEIALM